MIADAFSRYPTDGGIWPFVDPATDWCSPHNKVGCNFAVCYNTVDSDYPNLNRFYTAASIDENYCKIVKVIEHGYKRGQMRTNFDKSHSAHSLSYLWDTLCIVHDSKNHALIFTEDRILVPEKERVRTMENLHLSHLRFANTFTLRE